MGVIAWIFGWLKDKKYIYKHHDELINKIHAQ